MKLQSHLEVLPWVDPCLPNNLEGADHTDHNLMPFVRTESSRKLT